MPLAALRGPFASCSASHTHVTKTKSHVRILDSHSRNHATRQRRCRPANLFGIRRRGAILRPSAFAEDEEMCFVVTEDLNEVVNRLESTFHEAGHEERPATLSVFCNRQHTHVAIPEAAPQRFAFESDSGQVCVLNLGRPAAAALTDLVAAGVAAYTQGVQLQMLLLQLQVAGGDELALSQRARLTSPEAQHRARWIHIIYAALHMRGHPFCGMGHKDLISVEALMPLAGQVGFVLQGEAARDEMQAVTLDRSLATAGASGGCASRCECISPHFIPLSQLVLLTLKVVRDTLMLDLEDDYKC